MQLSKKTEKSRLVKSRWSSVENRKIVHGIERFESFDEKWWTIQPITYNAKLNEIDLLKFPVRLNSQKHLNQFQEDGFDVRYLVVFISWVKSRGMMLD